MGRSAHGGFRDEGDAEEVEMIGYSNTDGLERVIVNRGVSRTAGATSPELHASPHLTALRRSGSRHVYGDTADVEELGSLLDAGPGAIWREVDGNTANQPLVRKVVERYLEKGEPRVWRRELDDEQPGLARPDRLPLLYAIVCARIGNDMARAFAARRPWEVSLQLHMGLCGRPQAARWVGRMLRRMVPSAFVKVPFTPDAPDCLLVARDLERTGIPVNLTSTFSARQAVTAALFANVTRTNIFMGRLNDGLEAEQLGEHVCLEAQRALRTLRNADGVGTQLIVASMRDWRTFVRVAGCDAFTAPCSVVRNLLQQDEIPPQEIRSRLETSYEKELGLSDAVASRIDPARVARLYRVEPELVEFLRELRASPELAKLDDGEKIAARFEEAGFGDLFHSPTPADRREMERGKLPDLDGSLARRVPLDTHFSLLANADFGRHQDAIDEAIERASEPR